ncbi:MULTISPECIES: chemotaxis response regulator protein-glutamate methylesterase [Alteromonadaceae]|jgi:two-component system chemotaxis response regulator CheB|uniref:Protein-glutamate methylesterase/protein-glutamine glutaminase n=1 Tax=Brumicola blandensis TaxID=3075611 RepID=A0AAW8R720_9ALTE|nr:MULTISPECIES: chemotaxis response regulator protein-glutamate methylesterase [unclassified Alteromonas]MDT0583620.1 chemotaxis response regulator protein-glutamate methylesterase [Alteromonas sp. W409]MDT0629255.1 chemotaxis response regulator protein-glutamate methylesterase [Alteromonas sp. W364]
MTDIKVLVVDDSALIRSLLGEIIHQAPGMQLVGAAPDAFMAKDMVMDLKPDVITLDIEMPKVDGLTFLDRLMKARPTPVLMISTLTEKGADATIKSLELGAIDFIAKPKIDVARGLNNYQQEIVDKIRIAAKSTPRTRSNISKTSVSIPISYQGTETVVAIGASTGGTEAIREVLQQLSPAFPATIVTQHMPPTFTKSFAQRLNSLCAISVKEAEDGERILPGNVYIAPGDKHLTLARHGADYRIKLDDGPLVCGHKPSVDVMFASLAKTVGKNAVATVLTGMGKDGAKGLVALREAGALTMAQDEASCVVYGMPKAAVELGGTEHVFPLDKMSKALSKAVEKKGGGTRL